jgi:oligoribonuclease NrnB/cAMP/cGMP phosphodiesterase (DHH superfamily)
MKLHHLSHIDLDGYNAQLISSLYIKECEFYNTNYGKEIISKFDKIMEKINSSNDDEFFILITDVNLNSEQSAYVDKEVKSSNKNIKLQLLDHHITGASSASKYDWYYLDDKKSATMITYEYYQKYYKLMDETSNTWLKKLVTATNAIDIWIEENPYFEFGKTLSKLINDSRELSKESFGNIDNKYKIALLKEATKYIGEENPHIALDENIYFLKRNYLNTNNIKDTLDNIGSKYVVSLIKDEEDKFTYNFKEYKGIITFNLSHISNTANMFLKLNDDYDFFMNVNYRGGLSIRSNDKVNVADMAMKYFGGGGHRNASGGFMSDFKDIYFYDDMRSFVENKMKD